MDDAPDPQDLDWRETLAFERRRATEAAMWTLPGASLAAQAFLYSRGLDPNTTPGARLVVAVVGFVTAFAAIQILVEQGYRMQIFRLYLHARRDHRGADPVSRESMLSEIQAFGGAEAKRIKHYTDWRPAKWFVNRNAPTTWLWVMLLLAGFNALVAVAAITEMCGGWAPFSRPAGSAPG